MRTTRLHAYFFSARSVQAVCFRQRARLARAKCLFSSAASAEACKHLVFDPRRRRKRANCLFSIRGLGGSVQASCSRSAGSAEACKLFVFVRRSCKGRANCLHAVFSRVSCVSKELFLWYSTNGRWQGRRTGLFFQSIRFR